MCFLYQNIIVNNENGAASIRIQNHSTLNVTGLECKMQMGNISGCIFASHYCNISVYHSTFSMNSGSVIVLFNNNILTVDNSSFFNNSAPLIGGALYSFNSTLVISDSGFYYNKASDAGGGINLELSTAKINNCVFYDNSKSAVATVDNTNISIEDCTFRNNLNNLSLGGALSARQYCNLEISNTIFMHNSATMGGAVSANNHSILGMFNCFFSDNTVLFTSNILESNRFKSGAGGAIYLLTSVLEVNQSQFSNNYADTQGGAIFSSESSVLINDSVLQNNIAESWSGAITGVNYSTLTFEDSKFINNSVPNEAICKGKNYTEYGAGGAIVIEEWSSLNSYCHRASWGSVVRCKARDRTKKLLELQFQVNCRLGIYCTIFL